MGGWLAENWFNLLNGLGVVGSLLFTAVSLRSETRTRRIENLLSLTHNHRELWSELFDRPALGRVLDKAAKLETKSITRDEALYVNMVIQHLGSAYEAIKSGLTIKPEGMRRDVGWFFSLPIPRAIWERIKILQNDDFVGFVEGCLANRCDDLSTRHSVDGSGGQGD
jgi:hypothetical protein